MSKQITQEFRRQRLQELVAEIGGYAALGRALGYRDGAYISQLCKSARTISEDFVTACHALPGYEQWFYEHGKEENLFTRELVVHLKQMSPDDLKRMENLLRSALSLKVLR